MSQPEENSEFDKEARCIKVWEVKETVPAKLGKKPAQRSLGFARTKEFGETILGNLKNGGKLLEKEAMLVREKGEEEAELYILGKPVHCIFYVDNAAKLPLETFHSFSKDQQRYLTLISEPGADAEEEE